ncbi:DUF2514 domain-containing protein [Cupriavidus respiraculi]|uniref:DUF2514 family protein n=1 Tax=Cupriavidus respiraculi TaxID=195930 RepID=UPI001C96E9F1|nr:DUF2514 family protein [Cupriavidus respiraculi]MBY4945399.1 DUF2514 domain-containing protein [Cupriavidus respiraculi]
MRTKILTPAIWSAATAVPWRAVVAVAVGVLMLGAGWTVNGWRKDDQISRLMRQRAEERSAQALAHTKALDAARLEERRRLAAQMEIINEANKEAESARMAARDADAAAERLRRRIADHVASSPAAGDPESPRGGTSAGDPIGMLADVLGRADLRAGILAQYADAARIAGQACEGAYGSLMGQ